jgi:hypothetical protein
MTLFSTSCGNGIAFTYGVDEKGGALITEQENFHVNLLETHC